MNNLLRIKKVDAVKGILMLLVVVAHAQQDLIHDIISLFHMPLFFILSGHLLKREKMCDRSYLKNRAITLLIPYAIYLFIDWLFVRRDYSINTAIHLIWGGRALSGTYWYITCFITTLFLFAFLLRHFSDKTTKCLIFAGVLQ